MSTIPMSKYAYRIIIFSIIVAGIGLLFQYIFPKYASPAIPFIVLFFFFLSLFTMFIILRKGKIKEGKSASSSMISRYMLSRMIKFISCLVFIVIYILLNKKDGWRFGIAFVILYFTFSIFEVFLIKREQKNN